jgi:hypothetical protein
MVPMLGADDDLVAWLLEGDPSIRWRVHRDLLSSSDATVRAERAKVATEGWGAKLISLQDPDGRWGGGDYTPKWISTTYTLLHLLWLGLQLGESCCAGRLRATLGVAEQMASAGDLHRLDAGTANRCS